MRIPYFIPYFYAYYLTGRVYRNESSIVNLDNADGPGTHWMAYVYAKREDHAVYFDVWQSSITEEIGAIFKRNAN